MTDSAPTIPGAQEGLTGNFVDWLGLEFVEMSGDEVVCTWVVEPRMHQPYGIVHGGIHCSVVETRTRRQAWSLWWRARSWA